MEINLGTYIPVKGPRKTVYPAMKDKNPGAEDKISQGHKTQLPTRAQMICPRRMLIYCGNSTVMSLAALRLFADMLVPIVPTAKMNAAKKAAALLSHLSIKRSGSHKTSPYKFSAAEVTAMPDKFPLNHKKLRAV